MKVLLCKAEFIWHILAFMILLGAFVPLWRQTVLDPADPAFGDPVQRAFLAVSYLGLLLLLFHPKQAFATARRGALPWLIIGWVGLSLTWSVLPAITLRRALALLLASMYGLLLAVRYSPPTVLKMLGIALAVIVWTSLISVWLFPEWAVMIWPHPGAWQGVLYHKNALGRTCVLALLVFWVLYIIEKGMARNAWAISSVAALILLIGSRSTTSWIVILLLALVWLLLRFFRRLPPLMRPAVCSLGIAGVLPVLLMVPGYLEEILGFFGKDLTLTGRIPLWRSLIPLILERPLVGYGYGAFWAGDPSVAIRASFWWAKQAHNGYLDLWLEIGLIGILISIMLLLHTLTQAGLKAFQNLDVIYKFIFLYTFFLLLSNITEAMLLESGLNKALYWAILCYSHIVSNNNILYRDNSPYIGK